jgi:hypothetical protein
MLWPEEISQRVIDFTSALSHRGQMGRAMAPDGSTLRAVRKPVNSLGDWSQSHLPGTWKRDNAV